MTFRISVLILLAVALYATQSESQAPGEMWQVSGVVKTDSGSLKDCWVSIRGPESIRPMKTDSQGRYSFKGSLPGVYRIQIQKPEDASEPRSRSITLSRGAKMEGFDIVIPKGSSISGKVLDRAGRPVSGMVIMAYVRSYELGHMRLFEKGGALTDDRGEYRIAHLPDAAYVIAAVPPTRKPVRAIQRQAEPSAPLPPTYPPVTFSPSGRSHAAAAVVEVRGGADRHGVDILLEKVPAYCIYFHPASLLPNVANGLLVDATLYEWLDTRGPLVGGGGVTAGQDSQICGVPEGEYRLGVFGFSKQPMRGLGYGQTPVLVAKRHADAGVVNMMDFQSLTGTVAVRGAKPGEPIPDGIRVTLLFRNRSLLPSDTLTSRVETSGSFNLAKVYQDTYTLRIENLPKGHYVIKANQGGRDVNAEGVRPGGAHVQIELASDGPRLSGRVLTSFSEPRTVADATVFLVAQKGETVRIAQTDQVGMYEFDSDIEPGEYRIVAVPDLPESQRWDATVAHHFLANSSEVKLGSGEGKLLDLKLSNRQ